jgi:hypothetical protein
MEKNKKIYSQRIDTSKCISPAIDRCQHVKEYQTKYLLSAKDKICVSKKEVISQTSNTVNSFFFIIYKVKLLTLN